jgi:hypothetical protein
MAACASGEAAAAVSKRVVPICVSSAEFETRLAGSAGQESGVFRGNGIHIVLQSVADGFEGGLNLIGPVGSVEQLDHLFTDLASINGQHWVELKCMVSSRLGLALSIVPGCWLLDVCPFDQSGSTFFKEGFGSDGAILPIILRCFLVV